MDMLRKIVDHTKETIALRKRVKPITELTITNSEHPQDFKIIFKEDTIALIAEIKKASPSHGIIKRDLDPVQLGLIYETSGAEAISVVTNEAFFGGKCEYITELKKVSKLPLLRKDFILDEYQIYESRAVGADGVLLIARILDEQELKRMVKLVKKLGMTPIVEVHSREDIHKALATETEIIGINNRNLDNFQVDIAISLFLKPYIPSGYYILSESGIKNKEEVKKLQEAGFDGILVGTAILMANDIKKKIAELKWRD